eukprot:TRINITY_DN10695_c0_g2_i1.p2 TRINITY_DN10695_c0_g2~~TRINITY_DN10695_c0_g2_i1.p2  ORF type:complete len:177 (+),score=13.20 TRINITY_DN10695_c0_g2_i1:940-1470(+)
MLGQALYTASMQAAGLPAASGKLRDGIASSLNRDTSHTMRPVRSHFGLAQPDCLYGSSAPSDSIRIDVGTGDGLKASQQVWLVQQRARLVDALASRTRPAHMAQPVLLSRSATLSPVMPRASSPQHSLKHRQMRAPIDISCGSGSHTRLLHSGAQSLGGFWADAVSRSFWVLVNTF